KVMPADKARTNPDSARIRWTCPGPASPDVAATVRIVASAHPDIARSGWSVVRRCGCVVRGRGRIVRRHAAVVAIGRIDTSEAEANTNADARPRERHGACAAQNQSADQFGFHLLVLPS